MGRTKFDQIPQWAQSVLIFGMGAACFVFILVNRQPIPLRPMALQVRSGFTLFAPVALVLFFLIFSIKGFPGRLLSFVLILSLFALGLSGLWASGQTEPQVIGGLLPNVDAAEYYNNALRLMNGSNFFDYSSRRPIFPSYLTTLLWLSHKNLQVTLGIMVFIASVCTFIALSFIRKRFSSLVSAIFLILVYLFYRRYGGLVMSENLGFPLGIMGFALLMEGVFEDKKYLAFLSLFLLSYALNVRAGAFFILPLILLGLWQQFGKDARLKTALILTGIVAAGFIINLIIFKLLGSPTGTPFSNFAHTFYGLVQGGKGWTQIYADHPEILNLSESEISQKIYEYSWAAIKSNPWNLISGLIVQYGIFINFVNSNLSVFSFVYGENETVYNLIQMILYLLSLIGLSFAFVNRNKPFYRILLLAFLGTLLSVPLITADASYMRAYAASISFLVIFPAIGVGEIIKRFVKLEPVNPDAPLNSFSNHAVIMTTILIALPLIAILPRHINRPETNGRQTCPAGEENIAVEISQGSYLSIFPNSELFLDWVPNLHEARFKSSYISSRADNMREEVRLLPSRMQITNTIDLYSYKDLMLIIKDETIFEQIGRFSICGIWSDYPQFINVTRFFYADTYNKID
jgi:hypothetical protein